MQPTKFEQLNPFGPYSFEGLGLKIACSIDALSFALLLVAPYSDKAWGSESVVFKTEVGLSAMRFDYREFDDAGGILDKEAGGIPGLSAKIGQRFPAWD